MKKLINVLVAAAGAAGLFLGGSTAEATHTENKPTIVLLHGAFADGSSWNEVTKRLQRDGYEVVAPAVPLRGIASDTSYLNGVLAGYPRAEGARRSLVRRRPGQRAGRHRRREVAGVRGGVHPAGR